MNESAKSSDVPIVEPMWSCARVAAYMNVDIQTVRRWIWDGKLQAVKFGGAVRVRQSEVLRMVNGKVKRLEEKSKKEELKNEPKS